MRQAPKPQTLKQRLYEVIDGLDREARPKDKYIHVLDNIAHCIDTGKRFNASWLAEHGRPRGRKKPYSSSLIDEVLAVLCRAGVIRPTEKKRSHFQNYVFRDFWEHRLTTLMRDYHAPAMKAKRRKSPTVSDRNAREKYPRKSADHFPRHSPRHSPRFSGRGDIEHNINEPDRTDATKSTDPFSSFD
nr:hypothetical protein [uncultured Ruegeria sp.]